MPRDGSGTRATILRTAMRMFVEQGYDRTSLREIAEDVGVTKAALYYHFRTKEDIVRAGVQDFTEQLDLVVSRVEDLPPGAGRSAAFVDGLLDLLQSDGAYALRFGQANPTVLGREGQGHGQLELLKRLMSALAGPEPAPEAALRATLAYGALMVGALGGPLIEITGDEEGLRTAGRAVALDLLAPLERDGVQ
ncbi:TetR/AcrR family transcriptional regulator [Cellulomonas sp. URHE0023]|uniref:TetR/AcrR family transcriptional regulator n=1 Tax=Cellulomonas sp. URHE0023 TaxID=1380354 RepID=UPI000690CCFF|nr:TetR/AcrR family transcriptional regulator [Cellulomonas sp. URHE0023]